MVVRMTLAQIAERNRFADAAEALAKMAEEVPHTGWDINTAYIVKECRRWADGFRTRVKREVRQQPV